jgi:hypothetical protein
MKDYGRGNLLRRSRFNLDETESGTRCDGADKGYAATHEVIGYVTRRAVNRA